MTAASKSIAEGELEAMQPLRAGLRRGPPGARVEEVETTEMPASSRFTGFSVTG